MPSWRKVTRFARAKSLPRIAEEGGEAGNETGHKDPAADGSDKKGLEFVFLPGWEAKRQAVLASLTPKERKREFFIDVMVSSCCWLRY